jgi:hypothetical protein
MTDANGKPYESKRVNNIAEKQEDWNSSQKHSSGGCHQPQSLSPFKLVSSSELTPTQSFSPANIENAIQFLYITQAKEFEGCSE